jgi:DNA-binding transcriptional regulator YdaS (Cro superfamily)
MKNFTLSLIKRLAYLTILFAQVVVAQDVATCSVPLTLTVANNGSTYRAISWATSESKPSNGYEWHINIANNVAVEQSGTTSSTSLLILNLNENTDYLFYVRSVCSNGQYSDWITHSFVSGAVNPIKSGQVGSGEITEGPISLYGPMLYSGSTIRKGSAADMLFTTAELITAGIPIYAKITGVAFYKTTNASTGESKPVRMRVLAANSTKIAPLSSATTLANIETSHTNVMDDTSYYLPETIGWIDFNFKAPFTYTGTGLEITTAMYHEPTSNPANTTHFTSYISWQATKGFSDYITGTWVLPNFDINNPAAIILSNSSGTAYKERPNIKISYFIENSVQSVLVTIVDNAPAAITKNDGTLNLKAAITPTAADQIVFWEVIAGKEFATIDQNGVVTATDNGSVTIRATSAENTALFSEITIAISGQLSCAELNPGLVVPITLVNIANINNSSSEISGGTTPSHESFLSVTGDVVVGKEYTLTVKGSTNGNFTHNVVANIDWNQDKKFDGPGEVIPVGAIKNSTGIDEVAATVKVTVPNDALIGKATLRIVKTLNMNALPCNTSLYGQTEYYTLNVKKDTTAGLNDAVKTDVVVYPNPVTNILTITTSQPVTNIEVFNGLGQLALKGLGNTIDVSSLSNGIYMLKVTANGHAKSFKIVKQ